MDITQNPLIHMILFGGSFIAILICILLLTRKGNKKGYIIAPLTFFINLFAFNVVIYLKTYYNIDFINFQTLFDWSSIIRLHAFIILFASVLIEPTRNKYDGMIKKEEEKNM
jgi:hypothetical protein